jgi:hypothetical protein
MRWREERSFEDRWIESGYLRLLATAFVIAPTYLLLFALWTEAAMAGWLTVTFFYAAVLLVLSFSRVTGERWAGQFARTFLAMSGPFVWGAPVALLYFSLYVLAGAGLFGAGRF